MPSDEEKKGFSYIDTRTALWPTLSRTELGIIGAGVSCRLVIRALVNFHGTGNSVIVLCQKCGFAYLAF